jgi:DNA recombination protein RmuC
LSTVLLSIALFLFGGVLAWLIQAAARGALVERLKARDAEAARLGAELAAEKEARGALAEEKARLGAELAGVRADGEARLTELRSSHERLKAEFAELSAVALRANRDDFLKLAEQSFSQLHEKSAGDLAGRQQAIDTLVKPLRESLEKMDGKIADLENRRERAYGQLGEQLENLATANLRLNAETSKLSTALGATRTAGTWGELQLRRVVELAGMTEHCDFAEQKVFETDQGRIKPDLVVHMPGGVNIVVDAKAPTTDYREAAAESDPTARMEKLKAHAGKVREHIDDLSSKDYWAHLQPSPEFVVLFLPGDSFLSAAIESDPAIMDRAIARKVLLATPMTLVALLKAVAYSWKQNDISKSAAEVSRLGRDLYDKISTFADHLGATGRSLSAAMKAFNSAVGSFEQGLVPGARKFAELGAKGSKELEAPLPVDVEVREVAKRR